MPHARGLLGVLWAARLAISHRASLPRRRWGAASRAVATPRVAPGPAHAGSQVAPAQVDALKAANAGMALRLCLRTDRLRAFGRSLPTAPRHPRSTLSAPPGHSPASCVHPSHRPHPTHRSRTRSPPSATHTHHLHASRPPYTVLSRRCSELPFDLDQGWIHISVMHVGMWFDVLIMCQLSCGMHGRQFGRLRAPVGCLPPPRGQSAIFLETRHQCDALYMTFEMSSTTYKARVWFNSDV